MFIYNCKYTEIKKMIEKNQIKMRNRYTKGDHSASSFENVSSSDYINRIRLQN